MKQPLIIGIVGLPGAGKTTAAKYLVSKGFQRVTLSDFIKDEVKRIGDDPTKRQVLQSTGNLLREKYGPQILAQLAIKSIRKNSARKIVIDGIRNLYEVAFLSVENNFTLLGIIASPTLRYERLKNRSKEKYLSYDEFILEERREDHFGSKEFGLRVRDCLKKARYVINNNRSLRNFQTNLDAITKTLSLK